MIQSNLLNLCLIFSVRRPVILQGPLLCPRVIKTQRQVSETVFYKLFSYLLRPIDDMLSKRGLCVAHNLES